jgi:hypothetical protein
MSKDVLLITFKLSFPFVYSQHGGRGLDKPITPVVELLRSLGFPWIPYVRVYHAALGSFLLFLYPFF